MAVDKELVWTFQHHSVLEALWTQSVHFADWKRVSDRRMESAYFWMSKVAGFEDAYPPIWCWGDWGGKMQLDLLACALLLSDWEIAQGLVAVKVELPVGLAVYSCYRKWNRFLDFVLETRQTPCSPDDVSKSEWCSMFTPSGPEGETHYQQAVLPFLRQEWCVSIREVPRRITDSSIRLDDLPPYKGTRGERAVPGE